MAPKCNHCGSDMPDDEQFCRECGNPVSAQQPVQEESPVPIAENMDEASIDIADLLGSTDSEDTLAAKAESEAKPKTSKPKVKKPISQKALIILGSIAVVVLLIVILWTPISMFLFPKLALSRAFVNTGKDLENRFSATPFALMATAYDGSGQNTITLSADYNDPYLGSIVASGTVQTDTTARLATVSVGLEAFNRPFYINAYMDADKMALNCQQFTDDRFYGIVYESFAEDVRDNQILYGFLGEERLTTIDGYLQIIDAIMSPEQTQAGEGSAENSAAADILKDHILNMDPKVRTETVTLDSEETRCYVITVTMSESEFGCLMEDLIDSVSDDAALEHAYTAENVGADGQSWANLMDSARTYARDMQTNGQGTVTVEFYLHNNRIARADLQYDSLGAGHDGSCHVQVTLGPDPAESDILLTLDSDLNATGIAVDARLSTDIEGTMIREALGVSVETDGSAANYAVDYNWDSASGALWISAAMHDAEHAEPISLQMNGTLAATEGGFRIDLPEFGSYLAAVRAAKKGSEPKEMDCTLSLVVTAGCEITQPEFIDLVSMSGFQLYELISGLI